MKTERSSNIELLRILAMFLIVQSHFAFHGWYQDVYACDWNNAGSITQQALFRSMITGNLGNMIFMLITGYFLCKSSKLNLRKLISVVIQVFTYSFVCYLVYTILYDSSVFQIKDLFKAATPLIHDTYWYFSSYILIYIFHPYINRLIINTNQKELGFLILVMMVAWGFIPSLLDLSFGSSSFLIFCIFYLTGAYIRLYYAENQWFTPPHCGLIKGCHVSYIWSPSSNAVCLLICVTLWIGLYYLKTVVSFFDSSRLFSIGLMGSPLAIVLSISLFIFFLNLTKIKPSKTINNIALCTGGVYLLHMNPYVRQVLYTDIFHLEYYSQSNAKLLYTIGFILITFIVCALIEFVRKFFYNWIESIFVKK